MAEFFTMPAASPTMEIGRLLQWHAKEGDELSFGTIVAEVETDKASAEIESFEDSVLIKILRKAGDDVAVGSPIAIIGETLEDDISGLLEEFAAGNLKSTPAEQGETIQAEADRIKAGPAARVTADQHGVDIGSVLGTGPRGRVMSGDIRRATPSASQGPGVEYVQWNGQTLHRAIMESPLSFVPDRAYPTRRGKGTSSSSDSKSIPHSMMRRTIAKRLKESYLDAPTFFLNAKLECNQLVGFRTQLKEAGLKVSYNDLVIKAVARALRDVPGINSSWTEDAIIQHGEVHVGMAVALEGGLITPIIRNTDEKGLAEVATESRDLVKRAREGKLQPEEYTNSTFTISNLGMMAIEHFTAIINPPNAAILAVGSLQQEPVVLDGELTIGWRMKVTMTCDHRVIDGALGAEFLLALRKYIECPALLAT